MLRMSFGRKVREDIEVIATEDPLLLDALSRSTSARHATMNEIDLLLIDSASRENFGVREVTNILLDLRNLLLVQPR